MSLLAFALMGGLVGCGGADGTDDEVFDAADFGVRCDKNPNHAQCDKPPTVAIASPANGATVSGTVTAQGSSSDDKAVAKVEVRVDAGAWKLASGTTSWSLALDTTAETDGDHTITARATDSAAHTTEGSVTVTVSNGGGGGGGGTDDYGPQSSIACPAGAVALAPGQDIPSIVNSKPAGTAFCVLAGTHYPTSPINLKAGDSLTGQFGAIIDGTNVVMGYDITSTSIIRGWNCFAASCAGVTVRNLVVRNLAAYQCIGVYEDGSTTPGTGWTVDHNEVYGCHFGGGSWSNGSTTNNYFHDNGCGTGGYRLSNAVSDHNHIAYNRNSGCKWAAGDHLTITNNFIHDNKCGDQCDTGMNVGIWLDTVGGGNLIQGNVVQGHDVGIMYEATDNGRVAYNTVSGNSQLGIYNSNSNNVEIDHNTVTQATGMAFNLFEDVATGYTIHDNYFHDNTVDLTAHPNGAATGLWCSNTTSCAADYGVSKNNRFDYNTYSTGGHTTYNFWLWGGSALSFSQWQAIPQDAHGSVQ
jgi:parallel beta-helix repeat protein